MKITRITFDTDDGRTFELANEEELDKFFNNPNSDYAILLSLSFTHNLAGGFKWVRTDNPTPLPFLSPLVKLRNIRQGFVDIALRNLRREVNRVGEKTNRTPPPSDTG